MAYRRLRIRPLPHKCIIVIRLLLLAVLTFAVLRGIDQKVTPIINQVAAYEARALATGSINDAVSSELQAMDISYDSIVRLSRNAQGNITDLQTNVMAVNLIQTRISGEVLQSIKDMGIEGMDIPIGSLTGSVFLAGRGPSIHFKMVPIGTATTTIENQFEEAGINQTLHRIMLGVELELAAGSAGYMVPIKVQSSVCIAQTVIVGVTPDMFAGITGSGGGAVAESAAQREAGEKATVAAASPDTQAGINRNDAGAFTESTAPREVTDKIKV